MSVDTDTEGNKKSDFGQNYQTDSLENLKTNLNNIKSNDNGENSISTVDKDLDNRNFSKMDYGNLPANENESLDARKNSEDNKLEFKIISNNVDSNSHMKFSDFNNKLDNPSTDDNDIIIHLNSETNPIKNMNEQFEQDENSINSNDDEIDEINCENTLKTNSSDRKEIETGGYCDELGFYRKLKEIQDRMSPIDEVQEAREQIEIETDLKVTIKNGQNNGQNNSENNEYGKISVVADKRNNERKNSIRDNLGISWFDKTTDDYIQWKSDWDIFIKNKLIKNEPISLNRALKMRLRTGIPQDYRRKVWTALINMRVKDIKKSMGPDAYQNLVNKSYNNDSSINFQNDDTSNLTKLETETNHQCKKQIELDLLRTLPNNKHFERKDSIGITRVRRVLRAYAQFNPKVGYCQGMNRIAAVAMLILPEEDAFWCLVTIIDCLMPKEYYIKPYLAQVDCLVLSDLISKKMPKLHRHFQQCEIDLTPFTWFFTIFVDGFRPELMLRIWDCFLLEGDKVLFRFALSIIYIFQHQLMKMNDFASTNSYLNSLGTSDIDIEFLFQVAFKNMNPLSSRTIKSKRAQFLPVVQKGFQDRH